MHLIKRANIRFICRINIKHARSIVDSLHNSDEIFVLNVDLYLYEVKMVAV
jgi:hypothetical protein